jgi:hypothetical protein
MDKRLSLQLALQSIYGGAARGPQQQVSQLQQSNTLYDKGRQRFATAALNWTSDTIKICLGDSGAYTINSATHEYLTDVSGVAIIAAAVTLTSTSATGGACDGSDVTFSSVSGTSIEFILVYKDTGTGSTSPLIAYIDTATGLPITPNGGDIIVTWDNGPNRIFKL